MTVSDLMLAAKQLSANEQQALLTYLQHLQTVSEEVVTPRVAGLNQHRGELWMSDDFNAELPETFWF
jgi:hypothetical protein